MFPCTLAVSFSIGKIDILKVRTLPLSLLSLREYGGETEGQGKLTQFPLRWLGLESPFVMEIATMPYTTIEFPIKQLANVTKQW